MTSEQRMQSDIKTMDRREAADHEMRSNRNKNDELTIERRDKADKIIETSRERNDELTADRREAKDDSRDMAMAISLVLIVLMVGAFLILI